MTDPYAPLKTPASRADSVRSKASLPDSPDALIQSMRMDEGNGRSHLDAEVFMSRGNKSLMLFILCISQYLDIAARTSMIVFVNDINHDLGIDYESSTWILNSYGITFGSFLLFFGRVSDLYSAKPVFLGGFVVSGLLALGVSFVTNQYAFFVLRAFWGVAASATVPSAFRLICAVYQAGELQQALAYFGLSSAVANATGLILGGAFGTISKTGQMTGWRWFCRFCPMVSISFVILAFFVMPATKGPYAHISNRWRHLDLVGSTLILAALLLLNIGLTEGASEGWTTAAFLVPFCISWPLALLFFLWEWRKPDDEALLPASIWRIPNMKLMCFVALQLFAYVIISQLPLVERYQDVFHESTVKASLRLLPQGIAMCLMVIVAAPILKRITNMRYPIAFSSIVGAIAYIPWIYGDGHIGKDYWSYYFPAFIIGALCLSAAFLGTNITMMTSVPPSMAGIAGALFQVSIQTGVVTALSIQAGPLTVHPGSVGNFANVRISFWFQFGWGMLCGLLVLVFFKSGRKPSDLNKNSMEMSRGSTAAETTV